MMREIISNCEAIKGIIGMELDPINTLIKWLKEVKILKPDAELISYDELEKWERSGSETYFQKAKIHFHLNGNYKSKVIIYKAIVTLNSEKAFLDWERRRNILMSHDIPVSNWYYAKKAIIVEDLYKGSIKEVGNISDIEMIGKKLDMLGFNCLNYLADIRCDGNGSPFYIDFGFDLGEPGDTPSNNCQQTFNKYINSIENGKNIITH